MDCLAANGDRMRLSHQWSTGDVRHSFAKWIATDGGAAGRSI